jgi:glycosyltransferase involved in cell wall biosynthesis
MKNKFSILIPTLFQTKNIRKLVEAFEAHDLVDEIIVLDNTDQLKGYTDKKLTILNGRAENYVNRSWNILVNYSKCEYYALLNDDILIDPNILYEVLDHDWTIPSIIGLDFDSIVAQKNLQNPEVIPMIDKYESMPFGWGQAIFGKKSQWPEIPEYLKIWCGDNWLCNKLNPYMLQNVFWEGEVETTSGQKQFNEIKQRDVQRWEILVQKGIV